MLVEATDFQQKSGEQFTKLDHPEEERKERKEETGISPGVTGGEGT
jgi:hypothetical protein